MNVNVKCFSSLSNSDTCRYDQARTIALESGTATVKTLAEQVNVSENDVALVFVNGKRSVIEKQLAEGDRVAFVPAVGGM